MEEDLIIIEAFINNLLPQEERLQVEKRIQNDKEFAQLVIEVKTLLHGIAYSRKKQMLQNLHDWEIETPFSTLIKDGIILSEKKSILQKIQQMEEEAPPLKYSTYKTIAWIKRWGAVAAVFLITFASLFWYFQKKETPWQKQLVVENFEPLEKVEKNELIIDAQKASLEKQSKVFYDQKDWENASSSLKELTTNYKDTLNLLYLAISQLGNHKAEAALLSIQEFQPYASQFQLEEPTQWYQALAQLETGQIDLATSTLGKLISSTQYGKKANLLLISISKKQKVKENIQQDFKLDSVIQEDSVQEIEFKGPAKSDTKEVTQSLVDTSSTRKKELSPLAPSSNKDTLNRDIVDDSQKENPKVLRVTKQEESHPPSKDLIKPDTLIEEKKPSTKAEIIPPSNIDCSKVLIISKTDQNQKVKTTKQLLIERGNYKYWIEFEVIDQDIKAIFYSENGVDLNQRDEVIFMDSNRQRLLCPFIGVEEKLEKSISHNTLQLDSNVVTFMAPQLDRNVVTFMASNPITTIYIKNNMTNRMVKFTVNPARQLELQSLVICLYNELK